MSAAEQEALVRRVFHEGTAQPNPKAILEELFTPDYACHGPPGMEHSHPNGAEAIERCVFNNAFTNLRFTVEGITSNGDRVVARFRARGKQIAEFMGVPPRDGEVTASGITTFRVENNLIAEGWGALNWDR